jgi:5-formyltetrahydrofolate cyclo-ligase
MPPALSRSARPAVVTAAKQRLRLEMRRWRAAVSPADAETAAAAAAAHLIALPALSAARVAALYADVGSELGTAAVDAGLRARGVAVAYPRVVPGSRGLAFCPVSTRAALVPGTFGILEPPAQTPEIAPGDIDLFLVPGLAFDRDGGRIGWGHAYYDVVLAAHPRALRVGFAYAGQLVARVPADERDALMDYVITEAGVWHPGRHGAPGAPAGPAAAR